MKQKFSLLPHSTFTEKFKILQVMNSIQTNRHNGETTKLNAENDTLKNLLVKIQERKKDIHTKIALLREHNTKVALQLQEVRLKKDKKSAESSDLKKRKLQTFRE